MNCFVEGLRAYRGPGTAVMSQSTLSSELTQIPNHALRRVGTQQVQLPFLLIECESMSKLEGIFSTITDTFQVNVVGEPVCDLFSTETEGLFLLQRGGSCLLPPLGSHSTLFLLDDSSYPAHFHMSVSPDCASSYARMPSVSSQHQAQCLAPDLLNKCF